eukprot:s777_g24.t1
MFPLLPKGPRIHPHRLRGLVPPLGSGLAPPALVKGRPSSPALQVGGLQYARPSLKISAPGINPLVALPVRPQVSASRPFRPPLLAVLDQASLSEPIGGVTPSGHSTFSMLAMHDQLEAQHLKSWLSLLDTAGHHSDLFTVTADSELASEHRVKAISHYAPSTMSAYLRMWQQWQAFAHCLAHRTKSTTRGMPFGVLRSGFLGHTSPVSWCSVWMNLVREATHRTSISHDGFVPDFLIPHVGSDLDAPIFLSPMSRSQGVLLLRKFLLASNALAEVGLMGVHSCKVTMLSWSRQLCVDEELRRHQGHHRAAGSGWCVDLYSRDDVHPPLQLQKIIRSKVGAGFPSDASVERRRPVCTRQAHHNSSASCIGCG